MYNGTSYVLLYRVLCLSTQDLQDITAHVPEFCNSFRWNWGWRKVRPGHTSHKSPHGAQTNASSQWPGISQYVSASVERYTAVWLNILNHLVTMTVLVYLPWNCTFSTFHVLYGGEVEPSQSFCIQYDVSLNIKDMLHWIWLYTYWYIFHFMCPVGCEI